MHTLLSLLDANLKQHKHAARALEKAVSKQRFLIRRDYLIDEQAFFQAYIALREVEVRELHLLHETALLSQLLEREYIARKIEKKMEKTFKAQEEGNGKQSVIISKEELKKQEKIVNKDHRRVRHNAGEIVDIFLDQHEALVQAAERFKALDPKFALLHRRAERKILKIYTRAGGSEHKLRQRVIEEVEQEDRPLDLADALEAHRSRMRHHTTKLSNARRYFTAFIHQHFPMVGAL